MKLIYFVSYFLWEEIIGVSSTNNYFDGLIKYLIKGSKLHQVVFFRDTETKNADPIMDSLEKEVSMHFPSCSMSYSEVAKLLNIGRKMLFFSPRRTTLFVSHCMTYNGSVNDSNVMMTTELLKSLSRGSSLPRHLIINCYSQLLEKALNDLWQSDFLDVTLMTYSNRLQLMLEPIPRKLPLLSQFNPFTNESTTEMVSSNSQWFPNKLRHLNGYKLNFWNFYHNDSHHDKIKKERMFAEILAKAMDIKLQFHNSSIDIRDYINNPLFPLILRWISQFKGHYNQLEIPNPEIFLSFVKIYQSSFYTDPNLRILKFNDVKFVIPKTLKPSKNVVLSSEFGNMLMATIGIILIIRLTAFFMEFENSTYKMLNIGQIIMGITATQEPRNSTERLVFCSLLVACLVYSSYFYSVIFDISWRSEPEISSLEELVNSSLTLMMNWMIKGELLESPIPLIHKLGEKAISIVDEGWESDCWRYLIKYQNVSCLFNDAEYIVNGYAARNSLNVKFLPESVAYYSSNWNTKMNSPYIDRFNEVIVRASEFGLLEDFYAQPDVERYEISPPEKIEPKTLFLVLLYVSIIGYSLSIIVFLLEIFAAKFESRIHAFYMSFRFAN